MPTPLRADRRAHFLLQKTFLTALQNWERHTEGLAYTPVRMKRMKDSHIGNYDRKMHSRVNTMQKIQDLMKDGNCFKTGC